MRSTEADGDRIGRSTPDGFITEYGIQSSPARAPSSPAGTAALVALADAGRVVRFTAPLAPVVPASTPPSSAARVPLASRGRGDPSRRSGRGAVPRDGLPAAALREAARSEGEPAPGSVVSARLPLQIRVAAPGYATRARVFTVSSGGIQVAKRCIVPGPKSCATVRLSNRAVRVFGVLVVRDEVDVVRLCVLHHLTAGCERILVVDNGSSDGTTTVLRRLAKRTPLSWTFDPGPYLQDELMTGLAGEAVRAGAEDSAARRRRVLDGRGDLRTALASRLESGAVQVRRVDFVQRREQRAPEARGVLR